MQDILLQCRWFVVLIGMLMMPTLAFADAPTLVGDGVTDNTAVLQQWLDEVATNGPDELVIPKGVYLLGTVYVPGGVTITGQVGTTIRINTVAIDAYNKGEKATRANPHCLFALRGKKIRFQTLAFDFTLTEKDDVKQEQRPAALFLGDGCQEVSLDNIEALRPEPCDPIPFEQRKSRGVGGSYYPNLPDTKQAFNLASFRNSHDLLLENSRATFMHVMLDVNQCSRITSRHNWMTNGYSITHSTQGDQYLYHNDNWSRNVKHQCRWWGGNANDKRSLQPDSIGWGTATTVKRDVKETDEGFNKYTVGAYDIIVANNYAEYGTTLAWGAKGREIVFQGNIARFMGDYALGSEGGENVVYNGNVVINSYSGGLVSMYWGEKLSMIGNVVVTRDEPFIPEYSSYNSQQPYQGALIRLHAAASPSGSGSGQVNISGNVLSCEIPNLSRGITIHAGRDVNINGNTFHNASITKKGKGQLFVSNNQFTMTTSIEKQWINIRPEVSFVNFSGNTFTDLVPLDQRSPTELLMLMELGNSRKSDAINARIIENNTIIGFPMALLARTFSKDHPIRLLIQNNTTDGKLRVEGEPGNRVMLSRGNLDYTTFKPLELDLYEKAPLVLPQSVAPPAAKPQSQSISDEDRDADSEAGE